MGATELRRLIEPLIGHPRPEAGESLSTFELEGDALLQCKTHRIGEQGRVNVRNVVTQESRRDRGQIVIAALRTFKASVAEVLPIKLADKVPIFSVAVAQEEVKNDLPLDAHLLKIRFHLDKRIQRTNSARREDGRLKVLRWMR